MIIESNYSLISLPKEKIINGSIQRVAYQAGSVSLEAGSLVLFGYGDCIISLNHLAIKRYANFLTQPKGTTNIGGEMFGFEFSQWDKFNFSENGYKASITCNPQNNEIIGVEAYGELEEYDIIDEAILRHWYERSGEVPAVVSVHKKTIHLLVFKMNNGHYTYLQSRGDKNFKIIFDTETTPKALIARDLGGKALTLVESY